MATTGTPGNLPLFDDDTPVTPIQAPFNAISKALNDALKRLLPVTGQARSFSGASNGNVTVTHKAGFTPRVVFCQSFGATGGSDFTYRIIAITSTTFTVRVFYNGSAWNANLDASNGFDWIAFP